VRALNSIGRELYETTVALTPEANAPLKTLPGAAIAFACERLEEAGYELQKIQVATWVVRQFWPDSGGG